MALPNSDKKVFDKKEEKDANEKMEEFLAKQKKEDMVNHPKHYTFGKYEVIDIIDDWQLGFYEGQVIKYVARAKHKGRELEDLQKAQWYLDRMIRNLTIEQYKKVK